MCLLTVRLTHINWPPPFSPDIEERGVWFRGESVLRWVKISGDWARSNTDLKKSQFSAPTWRNLIDPIGLGWKCKEGAILLPPPSWRCWHSASPVKGGVPIRWGGVYPLLPLPARMLPQSCFQCCLCVGTHWKRLPSALLVKGEGVKPLLPLPARLPPQAHFQWVPAHQVHIGSSSHAARSLEEVEGVWRFTLCPAQGSLYLGGSGACGGLGSCVRPNWSLPCMVAAAASAASNPIGVRGSRACRGVVMEFPPSLSPK